VLRYESRRFDDDRAPNFHRRHDEKWRLRRDTCVVGFDLKWLAERWRSWQNGPSRGNRDFATTVFGSDDKSKKCKVTAERWARAVTDRRVGLALSGGGACAYRMVPLLEKLEKSGVPIDVVSGVSGGALLGAYYCTGGLKGVRKAVDRGPKFQSLVLETLISAEFLERQIDEDLAGASLEELEVRFVPVTTALRRGVAPETHAVVSGTVARGVRASGSAPLLFSRMRSKGIHYADGATATAVPARILWDYGADIVFACNCIPGPARRNPLAKWALGEAAYRSPLGRLLDLWITAAFLLQQISREMGEDAHGFFEPLPQEMPLGEMFNFKGAKDIVEKSRKSERVEKKVQEFNSLWQEFSR
jgi:NTE family protein